MLTDGDKGVIIQRDKKTYAVAPHIPCGVIEPDTLRKIADTAEKYNAAAVVFGHRDRRHDSRCVVRYPVAFGSTGKRGVRDHEEVQRVKLVRLVRPVRLERKG